MSLPVRILLPFLAVLFTATSLAAQPAKPLTVGIKHTPPFVVRTAEGWEGISIELWRRIAAGLNVEYRFREQTLTDMLASLRAGTTDVAVAALTITAEREEVIDFTHPFHTAGLGMAVPERSESSWRGVLAGFPLLAFMKVLGALLLALLVAAVLLWIFERRKNPSQFGGGLRGIGAGFWWAAVTLTTVGYGDKAPKTLLGRLLATVWMFISIFVISAFTATVASLLTTARLESGPKGPEDLPHFRVATVEGSTSQAYMRRNRISSTAYATPLEALEAMKQGRFDVMVYDAPILRYLTAHELPGFARVLPRQFELQHYGLALPDGSRLREGINRLLLKITTSPDWQDLLDRYLKK